MFLDVGVREKERERRRTPNICVRVEDFQFPIGKYMPKVIIMRHVVRIRATEIMTHERTKILRLASTQDSKRTALHDRSGGHNKSRRRKCSVHCKPHLPILLKPRNRIAFHEQ